MTIEEIKKKANELYPYAHITDHDAIGYDAFVKGAMWMQEQYEINEEELDKLAWEYVDGQDMPCRYEETAIEAFRAGYRKKLKQ